MSVLTKAVDRLSVTPLLYVIGGLLILSGVLGFNLKLANADKAVAESARDAAQTERESWKGKAVASLAANAAYAAIIDKQERINAALRVEALAAAQRAANEVANAKAEAAKATAEREAFKRRFNAKPKDCEAALDAMQAACPTLGGY